MPAHDGTLIFVHIFKTAGTSLRMLMAAQYPAGSTYQFYKSQDPRPLEEMPSEFRENIRLMSSHEPIGTHEAYLTPPIHYITMLRDPVDRVISQFSYRKGMDGRGEAKGANLLEFSSRINGHQDNLHVRFLSGLGFGGAVTERELEQAKSILASPSMTFGVVEQYEYSLLLFGRKFNWKDISLTRRNVTPRSNFPTVSEADRRVIAEHNQFDMALYEYAQGMFSQRLSAAGITWVHYSKLYFSTVTGKARYSRALKLIQRLVRKLKDVLASRLKSILTISNR